MLRVFLCLLFLTACREPPTPTPSAEADMQQPLTSFRQVLTSSITRLTLHRNEETKLPVIIHNPATETWTSTGKYPVTISYKWFKAGKMLPLEGERTVLPNAVSPNQSVQASVRVVAPDQAGAFALRVTLVQEAVAWFMLKSNTFLELPVIVQ